MTNDELSKMLRLGYPISTQPHECSFCGQVMEMPLIHTSSEGVKYYGHPCSNAGIGKGGAPLRFSP